MRNTLVPAFVGFDDLFDRVFGNRPVNGSHSLESLFDTAYPRYNLIKSDTGYVIEIALAGFSKEDLAVSAANGILTVVGKKETPTANFLHQGISSKTFTRTFDLNSNLEVGEVTFVDGILTINLVKIEESDTVRKIEIK